MNFADSFNVFTELFDKNICFRFFFNETFSDP